MAKRNTTGMPKKDKIGQAPQNSTSSLDATPEQEQASGGGSLIQQIQQSAQDPQKAQGLIVRGIIGIIVLLVLLIGVALAWETLIVPGQTVAVVNGQSISVADFQERVRLERTIINQRFNIDLGILVSIGQDPNAILQQEPYGTWWNEITQQPEALGSRVLSTMINEQIIRGEAARLGVTVDEALIDEEVDKFFNFVRPQEERNEEADVEATEEVDPTATPTPFVSPTPSSTPRPTEPPTSTPTPEATATTEAEEDALPSPTPRATSTPQPTRTFDELEEEYSSVVESFYQQANARADLSRETVRSYFEYQALLTLLRDEVTADVGGETTYVDVRHILVATEEEAGDILAALEAGESFADLARAVSLDEGSGARGGELGWAPASNYVPEFEAASLETEIGDITEPVQSDFGYHILQVRGREDREMTEDELENAKDRAFDEWFQNAISEENNDIERKDNWPDFIPEEPAFIYAPIGIDPEA